MSRKKDTLHIHFASLNIMAASSPSHPVLLYSAQAGLCNQLLALINGIIRARRAGLTQVKLSPFLTCIFSRILTSADKVFDLEAMSSSLGMTFIPTEPFRVLYGVYGNYNDVTDKAISKAITEIPACDGTRAGLFGDHLYGVRKHVLLFTDGKCEMIDREAKTIEIPSKAEVWDPQTIFMGWYSTFQEFSEVFSRLKFHSRYRGRAKSCLAKLDRTRSINVVHLRIEEDGVDHWSKMNGMGKEEFRLELAKVYRGLLSNIPLGSQLVILTYDHRHPMVTELRQRYDVHTFDHAGTGVVGRELHAIIDLLIGISCTGTFIGCHNLALGRGSTFSYFLHRLIAPEVKRFFIDLDNVRGV